MKIISFYLPQFHTFPENDEWWGKGFTEWTNTRKAKPLFPDHYQPHTPLHEDYYDLTNPETMIRQVDDAKKYGVYGFCFYHYWFKDGKMLMEKPMEHFLQNKNLKLHYCISWANEPWTRRWDGGSKKILMPQEYGDEKEWEKHFLYLLPFLRDERYIEIDGKPLVLIYRPDIIPCLTEMINLWNKLAKKNGFKGLTIMAQGSTYCRQMSTQKRNVAINYYLMYEPGYTYCALALKDKKSLFENIIKNQKFFFHYFGRKIISMLERDVIKVKKNRPHDLCDYDILWEAVLNNQVYDDYYPGAFTSWDNSARRGCDDRIVVGSTPEKFKKYLIALIYKTKNQFHKDCIFINAWNEWAEGAHLEADEKYGYGYLEAVKEALLETSEWEN